MLPQRSQRQASMAAAQRLSGDIPNLARMRTSVQSSCDGGAKRQRLGDAMRVDSRDSRDDVVLDSLGWISGSARNLPVVGLFASGGAAGAAAGAAASAAAYDMSRYDDDLPIPSGDVYPEWHQDSLEAMKEAHEARQPKRGTIEEEWKALRGERDAMEKRRRALQGELDAAESVRKKCLKKLKAMEKELETNQGGSGEDAMKEVLRGESKSMEEKCITHRGGLDAMGEERLVLRGKLDAAKKKWGEIHKRGHVEHFVEHDSAYVSLTQKEDIYDPFIGDDGGYPPAPNPRFRKL